MPTNAITRRPGAVNKISLTFDVFMPFTCGNIGKARAKCHASYFVGRLGLLSWLQILLLLN